MSETNEALRRIKAHQTIAAFKAQQAEPPCDECDEDPVTAAAKGDIPFHGYATLYDVPSGDGRMIAKDSLTWDLAEEGIPIIWDRDEGDHSGMVLGRVDTAMNDGVGPFVTGRFFATTDPIAKAAVKRMVELIRENALGWSVALDGVSTQITVRDPQVVENEDGTRTVTMAHDDDMAVTTSGRIRHLAIVDTPALPGARPIIGRPSVIAAAAMTATYPPHHFEKWPESRTLVPLQTTPDGRFWGHAAGDGCFRGAAYCEKYTRDPDPTLANFHTSTATLDNGEVIRVGVLTAAGIHADTTNPMRWSVEDARRHHEDSSTIYAKVRAWEDSYGRLCLSGSMIPGLDPTFAAQVSGLPVSVEKFYDSRGRRTLCAALAVPNPAWPVLEPA